MTCILKHHQVITCYYPIDYREQNLCGHCIGISIIRPPPSIFLSVCVLRSAPSVSEATVVVFLILDCRVIDSGGIIGRDLYFDNVVSVNKVLCNYIELAGMFSGYHKSQIIFSFRLMT